MSRKYPLSYPAPIPKKRTSYPLRLIPRTQNREFLFDAIFSHSAMRERFQKVSVHGTIPILLGGAVTATGHSQMLVRSLAVVICAVWLSLDIGVWLSEAKWSEHWKGLAFCASSSVLCCLAMGIMYWFLASTLEDQRNETLQHLTAEHHLVPGEEDDPMHTMFSVNNGGTNVISRKHGITCLTNLAVGNNGTSESRGISSWIDNGQMVISGLAHTFDRPPASSVLLPGGDAQTDQCLKVWGFANGTDCADVTVIFWYSLDSQPDIHQEKDFRFVAYKSKTGQFSWYGETISEPKTYCERYLKPRPVTYPPVKALP